MITEELHPEKKEAGQLLNETRDTLSNWAWEYAKQYRLELDGQEAPVENKFLALIDAFKEAVKQAEEFGLNVTRDKIILRLIEEQPTTRDKAVFLAGFQM